MPADLQDTFGYALPLAQFGGIQVRAKALKGFGSAGVIEAVERDRASRPVTSGA